jgi:hypothetical protein
MGHKITNVPLILKIWVIIFLFLGKLVYGPFLRIFCGGLNFFDPQIVPSVAGDNLEGQKSLNPPQNIPRNGPQSNLPAKKIIIYHISQSAVHH